MTATADVMYRGIVFNEVKAIQMFDTGVLNYYDGPERFLAYFFNEKFWIVKEVYRCKFLGIFGTSPIESRAVDSVMSSASLCAQWFLDKFSRSIAAKLDCSLLWVKCLAEQEG
ncbi:MAG: hypothetical protein Q7S83_04020 [bacterium]|nr:hypothetical protein [bacterium]